MSLSITSCCINGANNAWVTCLDYSIYAIVDITNSNSAWTKIAGGAKQIVCNTRLNNMIAVIGTDDKIYFATKDFFTNPNWALLNGAAGVKYISLDYYNNCSFISTINTIWSSTKPINETPGFYNNTKTNITYNKKGDIGDINGLALAAYGAYAAIISGGNLYVTTNIRTPNPAWEVRVFGGNTIVNVAVGYSDIHLLWINGSGFMSYKTRWDNGNTMGDIGGGYKFCSFALDNFIAIKTDNTVEWGTVNAIKGRNNNNLVDKSVAITNYINTGFLHIHASLNNELSNPNIAKTDTIYGPKSFIQRMAAAGITNFSPFKILSLYDLVMIGRASKVNIMAPYGGDVAKSETKRFDLWIMTFDQNDPYLPLGDVIIPTNTDINKVMCILVKNDDAYRTVINPEDYKIKNHSWIRNEGYWSYTWNGGSPVNIGHRAMFSIHSAAKSKEDKK